MNALKKLKLQLKARRQAAKEQKLKRRFGERGLARQCMHCRWFTYREEKPRNWVCRCPPEKMRFYGSVCLAFEPGEHPEMVPFNSG
jgi:ferredoxin-thioredoxin reductase catalytic subunit